MEAERERPRAWERQGEHVRDRAHGNVGADAELRAHGVGAGDLAEGDGATFSGTERAARRTSMPESAVGVIPRHGAELEGERVRCVVGADSSEEGETTSDGVEEGAGADVRTGAHAGELPSSERACGRLDSRSR